MNKIYKVIWSKTRNAYMAVAEFVKRNGKGASSLNRRHIAAALAAAVLLAVQGNALANSGGEYDSNGNYVGVAPYKLVIDETVSGDVYGRQEHSDKVSGAKVEVKDGGEVLYDSVYGGWSVNGSAESNTVTVSGGTVLDVYGGRSRTSSAESNTVTVSGGTVNDNVIGGRSYSGSATKNSVNVSGGTVLDVIGGWSVNGSAESNTVSISGGTVKGFVYGGLSNTGAATGNTVILAKEKGKDAPVLNGTLYGGYGKSVSDNTLQVEAVGLSAPEIQNFDNYKFVLPSDIKAGDTMLGLHGQFLEIDGSKVSVSATDGLDLGIDERVTLMIMSGNFAESGHKLIVNNPDKLPVLKIRLDNTETGFETLVGNVEQPHGEYRLDLTVTEKYLYGDGGSNTPGQREKGNTLTIGAGEKATAAFGGRANTGDAVTENKVTMSGGEIGIVYGGLSENGSATGNTVTISGGEISVVYGGYSEADASGTPTVTATGNTVTISDGTIGAVYGSKLKGLAENNTGDISGGT